MHETIQQRQQMLQIADKFHVNMLLVFRRNVADRHELTSATPPPPPNK